MNERIKELAEQAGFHVSKKFDGIGWVWCSDGYPIDEELTRFAELIRQDECEAIARMLETRVNFNGLDTEPLILQFALNMVAGFTKFIRERK